MEFSHLPRVEVVPSIALINVFDLTSLLFQMSMGLCFSLSSSEEQWAITRSCVGPWEHLKLQKYQLHPSKNTPRCFQVARLPLCKRCHYAQISCFSSRSTSQVSTIQNQGGKHLSWLLWGMKGNIVPVICGTLRERDPGVSVLLFYSLEMTELIY